MNIRHAAGLDQSMGGKAVPFLADDVAYASMWLAAWMSGASCLPLCNTHPVEELRYAIATSDADVVLVTPRYEHAVREACALASLPASAVRVVEPSSTQQPGEAQSQAVEAGCELLQQRNNQDPALMLYTSGTTSNPKGVIHTHGSLSAQTEALAEAWGWTPDDRCLNVLPMHHLHGVVVLMLTAMSAGATVDWANQGRFSPQDTWRRLLSVCDTAAQPTVFMAVPTIYGRLLDAVNTARSGIDPFASDWDPLPGSLEAEEKAQLLSLLRDPAGLQERLGALRLMTSGSAPLAESMGRAWEAVSGHRLLERLGMTETGMIASNPLDPVSARRLGTVGTALPGVEVCLGPDVSDPDQSARVVDEEPVGELWVRGPALFKEYYKRPEAMAESFTEDGWFRTGDIASIEDATGTVRVLGRASADIIKSGGYKLSALDIETVMLDHGSVSEVTVFGVDDDDVGERVVALVVGSEVDPQELREWLKGRLAAYKVPRDVVAVGSIPRNAMGKVNKKQLRRLWQEDGWRGDEQGP